MKKIYTYTEIKEKINSGDSIKYTEIEKMLRHLMMRYTCLEWERDQAREEAEVVRALYKNALGVTLVTFPWEEGSG
jgi:hypothetical protein